jgi:hypothetical protein
MTELDELFADDAEGRPADLPTSSTRPTTATFAMQFADAASPEEIERANPGPRRRGGGQALASADTAVTSPLPLAPDATELPTADSAELPAPRRVARGAVIGGALALLLLGGAATGLTLAVGDAPSTARAASAPDHPTTPPLAVIRAASQNQPAPASIARPRPADASTVPSAPAEDRAHDPAADADAALEEAVPSAPVHALPSEPPAPQPTPTETARPSAVVPHEASPATAPPRPTGDEAESASTPEPASTPSPAPSEPADEPDSDRGLVGDVLDSLLG